MEPPILLRTKFDLAYKKNKHLKYLKEDYDEKVPEIEFHLGMTDKLNEWFPENIINFVAENLEEITRIVKRSRNTTIEEMRSLASVYMCEKVSRAGLQGSDPELESIKQEYERITDQNPPQNLGIIRHFGKASLTTEEKDAAITLQGDILTLEKRLEDKVKSSSEASNKAVEEWLKDSATIAMAYGNIAANIQDDKHWNLLNYMKTQLSDLSVFHKDSIDPENIIAGLLLNPVGEHSDALKGIAHICRTQSNTFPLKKDIAQIDEQISGLLKNHPVLLERFKNEMKRTNKTTIQPVLTMR